ncbi:MAG: cytochrome c oxidase subunit 3 [Porticoccaceae bacterium]
MATTSSYYLPEPSKLPVLTATSLGLMALGAGRWVRGEGWQVLAAGLLLLTFVLYTWFSTVIRENHAGLTNAQVKRSFVWGMSWFIFSEVMFFAAFFGALLYVRVFAVPWLGGEGGKGDMTGTLLWQGFQPDWPLMTTPDQVAGGTKFIGPHETMGFKGWGKLLEWLPLWNTILLLTSSWTVHIAHHAMKHNNRAKFNLWLAITVALGVAFLCVQYVEYHEAYAEMGLTLKSGIYGTTFFMLTGFHGFHVALGTFILAIQLLRGLKGHFKADDQFGFEAASWYWHFVDVVWVGLFIFVYVLGS